MYSMHCSHGECVLHFLKIACNVAFSNRLCQVRSSQSVGECIGDQNADRQTLLQLHLL